MIHKILVNSLHVRRPPGRGADPLAGPGGVDYRSSPLPNERLDCEKAENLFKNAELVKIGDCLRSIADKRVVTYSLKREASPELVLEEAGKAPKYLGETLATIPVPREIVFQTIEEESDAGYEPLPCYTARLDVEADEALGSKVPMARVALQLQFPLKEAAGEGLKKPLQVEKLLVGWALTPLWNAKSRGFQSKVLTHRLCQRCMGEKNVLSTEGTVPVFWP